MRCVCGQLIAPSLAALGSVLCHDCRDDRRRAESALGRARVELVRAEVTARIFKHRRAA